MEKLANPVASLPPFGQAHYFERADGNRALMNCGFVWNTDECCWMLRDGADLIRAQVRFAPAFDRFYISSVL